MLRLLLRRLLLRHELLKLHLLVLLVLDGSSVLGRLLLRIRPVLHLYK